MTLRTPAGRARRQQSFQGLTGGLAQAMGFEPAFHPDVAAFGFPDFDEFEGSTAAWALEWVIAEAGFDPLAPFEVVERLGQ